MNECELSFTGLVRMDEDYENHHYILIFHPKDRIVITRSDSLLPAMVYHAALGSLDQVCDYVRKLLNLSGSLIHLRHGCEELQHYSFKNNLYASYKPKLFVFKITRTEVPKAPDGYRWIPLSNADNIRLDPPVSSVSQYLKEYCTRWLDIHGDRLYSYSRPGWFDEASDWTRTILKGAGHDVAVESIMQLKNAAPSCVLLATSTSELSII